MSIAAFTEKNHQPTQTDIVEVLGAMLQPWQALVQHIRATYHGQEDLKFCYGKRYGWALRFRIKGSLLTALYPARNGFVVQIILSRLALEQAQALTLGDAARQSIARAKPYPEGKWLFIPVQSEQDFRDVQSLLALKQGALSRKKAAGISR
ncbi:MAG TPA: DUF3788 family protein [Bryobacteraceae bacterium]|nr:DUF3788 family protein [Bryobacteraceae bacterium]